MTLFEECLEVLGDPTEIIKNEEEKNEIIKKMISKFPPTFYGRIDWEKISEKHAISSPDMILSTLKAKGKTDEDPIYIIWSDSTMPVLKSKLKNILGNFDDIEAVSPDTWLYCPSAGWIIELCHDGDITLGFE